MDGIQYQYDAAGRLTKIIDYDAPELTYAYDDVGNVTSMTDYHGNTTSYTYTALNQLDTLTAPGSRVWDWTYNDSGQPTQYTHPNGMITKYAYDTLARLQTIDHMYDATNVAQSFDYDLNLDGNIARVTHEDDSYWDYTYDGRGRLTFAERRDASNTFEYSEAYTYDNGDNMTQKVVTEAGQSPVTITYTVNNANELTAMTGGLTFTYDAWGRQTQKTDGTYTAQYDYHYGSKLTDVTSSFPTEGNVGYTYGGDQKRRSRDDGTNFTAYRWDIWWNRISDDTDGGVAISRVSTLQPYGAILAEIPTTGNPVYYTSDVFYTVGLYDQDKSLVGYSELTPGYKGDRHHCRENFIEFLQTIVKS